MTLSHSQADPFEEPSARHQKDVTTIGYILQSSVNDTAVNHSTERVPSVVVEVGSSIGASPARSVLGEEN